MNCKQITDEYYGYWIGADENIDTIKGVRFMFSRERDIIPKGYSTRSDLYIWSQPGKLIVSYGTKTENRIEDLRNKLVPEMLPDEILRIMRDTFGAETGHNVKYLFECVTTSKNNTLTLSDKDFGHYLEFFKAVHPGFPDSDTDWLEEYFAGMVLDKTCVGVFADDKIVSCTDAPEMPYIPDKVQEIGINTLEAYRGKGYASSVCAKCAENIIANGKVPQWSTQISNIPSQKLAEHIGFKKYADVLTLKVAD
ncbi:hypothetical protein FACS1894219_07580 [Clostridia bacterium]|nr:hypothetical protein FACS1894219_07580 [Clostridia bacterium]